MPLGREPLLQFAVGGALLFAVWAAVQRGKAAPGAGGGSSAAAPLGSGTPVSRTVVLDAPAVDAMRASFRANAKREPSAAELSDLVQEQVDQEILFREGLARGLDRDDGVVRRRLIEKTTALLRPTAPTSDPPREELRRWYDLYRHRFARPALVTFDQIFFDQQRRGDARAAAVAALASLGAGGDGADSPPPAGVGDRFVLPARMADKSDIELGHLYGEGFARALAEAPIGRWLGPVASRHGLHLVRVDARQAARLPPFEEVEKLVRADWLTVETRGQRAAAEMLLPGYDVVLPAELRREVGDAPALGPILKRAR